MIDIKRQVGEIIRQARKEKGLTQKELSDRLGIDESRISKFENGNQNPTLETVQRIADVLNIEITVSYK